MSQTVHTVLGKIDASELGITYAHEHLLTQPSEHLLKGSDDTILDSLDKSAAEMELFKQAGGQAIVELSCSEYGRDAGGLAELSRRTGVHVIAATGHIMEGYWRGVLDLGDRTIASLGDRSQPRRSGAGSGRGGQVLVQRLGGCPPAERLARSAVQRRGDRGEEARSRAIGAASPTARRPSSPRAARPSRAPARRRGRAAARRSGWPVRRRSARRSASQPDRGRALRPPPRHRCSPRG